MRVCDQCKESVEPDRVSAPLYVSQRKPMSESLGAHEFCSRACVAAWAVPPPTIEEQAESMVAAFSSAPEWESIDLITQPPPRRDEKWELTEPGAGRLYGQLLVALCVATAIAIATITIMENLR